MASDIQASRYEKEQVLFQYLLFHYGSREELIPFNLDLRSALFFPERCVSECLNVKALPPSAKALELGCGTGRSSFELSRYCESVLAIDSSQAFIAAAKEIQEKEQKEYWITVEGANKQKLIASLPEGVKPERVAFRCGDALQVIREPGSFDVVLAANVLCRLRDPLAFLAELPGLTAPKGQLILISPYSWSEEFTPPSRWLGGAADSKGKSSLDCIQEALKETFALDRVFDMPFLIREHLRKYELGIAQATLWTRFG